MRVVVGNRIKLEIELKCVLTGELEDPFKLIFLCAKKPFVTTPVIVYDYEFEYPTDSEIVRKREGIYFISLVPEEPGEYYYRWATARDSDEDVAIAEEGIFEILASELPLA